MRLADLFDQYYDVFTAKYADQLSSAQWRAMGAIRRCRTAEAGTIHLRCRGCDQPQCQPLSCGHRSCPQCQHHEAGQWLERQQAKLLPVDYFMVTFTLPEALRSVAWKHSAVVYALFFDVVASTLQDFGRTSKTLGARLGLTAVLHTHNRRLDYHPHIHVIVPGGGIDTRRRQWKKAKGRFLFNAFALSKVFRARFLDALTQAGLPTPPDLPTKWVVHCQRVGKGLPALKYLSRYLYRGVISENAIVANHHGHVTFRYTESKTNTSRTRTLPGEDFLWLVLQHVLPKGLRRVRDYGFLHGNAKKTLRLVQLVLQVRSVAHSPCPRPVFRCAACQSPLCIIAIRRPHWSFG